MLTEDKGTVEIQLVDLNNLSATLCQKTYIKKDGVTAYDIPEFRTVSLESLAQDITDLKNKIIAL